MGASCASPRNAYIPLSNSPSQSIRGHSQVILQDSKTGTPAALVSRKRMIFVLSPVTRVTALSPVIRRMTPTDTDIIDRLMEYLRPLYFNLLLENMHVMKRAIYEKNPKLQVAESKSLKRMIKQKGSIFPDYWKVYDNTETATKETVEAASKKRDESGENPAETPVERQEPEGGQQEVIDIFAEISQPALPASRSTSKAKKKKKKPRKESDNYLRQVELLKERLTLFQFRKINVKDDGNCLFRAASWNLFGTESSHRFVRKCAVERMKTHPDDFQIFFSSDSNDFSNYLRQLSLAGNWGDELCIRAIADAFSCTMHILTTTPDNWYWRYDPANCDRDRVLRHLFLTYISPSQYDAFYVMFDESAPASNVLTPAPNVLTPAPNESEGSVSPQ
ncbi:OTU family cysteine protease [Cardiosporidium cionae]|uniref:OTU family cysteine protease n=1 Tax=Cardiosporidium cionae TaxID=476202 RepID=A0ABQ7J902_9APIC|nr:OTU family cysteine protease [Cardiosporidium cionae]|eukprot:KAF8820409.1 OTU family cysteine protease [Cardiosporidium cionae]